MDQLMTPAAPSRAPATATVAPGIFVFIWSSGFVVARYAMRDAGPLTFLSLRLSISAAVLFVVARLTRQPRISGPIARWAALASMGLNVLYIGGVWLAIDRGLPASLGAH